MRDTKSRPFVIRRGKKGPPGGVIGVQKGPLGGFTMALGKIGDLDWDAGPRSGVAFFKGARSGGHTLCTARRSKRSAVSCGYRGRFSARFSDRRRRSSVTDARSSLCRGSGHGRMSLRVHASNTISCVSRGYARTNSAHRRRYPIALPASHIAPHGIVATLIATTATALENPDQRSRSRLGFASFAPSS